MSAVGYHLWRMHPDGSVSRCAKFALDALESGVIRHFQFQYSKGSESLDPCLFPRQMNPFRFTPESRDLPGMLDDLLPDRWGRAVIARYYALQGEVFRPSSTLDILNRLSDSGIGALRVQRVDPDQFAQPPSFALGSPLEKLNLLSQPQNRIDRVPPENLQGLGLQLLLGGSSVGGARPKLLTYDNMGAYIAKFPRQDDPFDMVSVEHACLRLAEAAGARVAASSICEINAADQANEEPQQTLRYLK
ncbi:MAG: type II toxin-antitoxin system HipA family toxin, partial [Pseudomonadales bacterium]|nr:type II toxin-antitoxin system HipA family toxin [Pseudomonadales bacterium]